MDPWRQAPLSFYIFWVQVTSNLIICLHHSDLPAKWAHTRTALALFLHVISLSFRLIRQDSPGRYTACLAFAIHAHLRSCAPVVHLPLDNKVALQAGPLYIVLCPQPHTHGRTIWPCHNLTVRVINWHVDVSLEEED